MSEFKVGDHVHWTRRVSRGRTIDFKTMQGVIINAEDPAIVTVKYSNGRKGRVHTSKLRKEGERTELTDIVEELGKRSN